jgi:hypothetical protein
MRLIIIIFSCYLFITPISAQNASAEEIILNFLEVSGGVETWRNLEYFHSDFMEINENDSTVTEFFSDWYKSNHTCYVKHSEYDAYHATPISSHNKKNGEEWRSMQVITDFFGVKFTIRYEEICYALKFVTELDSLSTTYRISNKDFGDEFLVLEKDHPQYEMFGRVSEPKINYFIFGKSDGLLKFHMLFKEKSVIRVDEFLDYKKFGDYLFPTVQRKASTKTKILKESRYAKQFKSEINKVTQPKIITYQKVIFNQPIDESVFDMN